MKMSEFGAEVCGERRKGATVFGALLAHERARRRALRRQNGGALSSVLSLVAAVALAVAAGYVFYCFADVYVGVRAAGKTAVGQRLEELLSLSFFLSVLFSLPSAVSGAERAFFRDGERQLLATLPVKSGVWSLAGLLCDLPRQAAVFCGCILTLAIPCAVAADKSAGDVALYALCALPLFPVTVLAGVIFALPLGAAKNFFRSHVVLSLLLTTAAVCGFFALYSAAVERVVGVLAESNPHAVFNAERAETLSRTFMSLYPASLAARSASGDAAATAMTVCVGAISAACLAPLVLGAVPRVLRIYSSHAAFRSDRRAAKSLGKPVREHGCVGVFAALLRREITAVLRTGKAFGLFAPVVIAPLVAGLSAAALTVALGRLMTLNAAFPLALAVGVTAAVLPGGASASAVTADKEYFAALGTLSVSSRKVFAAKALLYGGVAFLTGVLSSTVAALSCGLDGVDVVGGAFCGGGCALATSLVALKFDLTHPVLAFCASENGKSAAIYFFAGLSVCIAILCSSAVLCVYSYASGGALFGYLSRTVPVYITLFVLLLSALYCAVGSGKAVRAAYALAATSAVKRVSIREVYGYKARKVFRRAGVRGE